MNIKFTDIDCNILHAGTTHTPELYLIPRLEFIYLQGDKYQVDEVSIYIDAKGVETLEVRLHEKF